MDGVRALTTLVDCHPFHLQALLLVADDFIVFLVHSIYYGYLVDLLTTALLTLIVFPEPRPLLLTAKRNILQGGHQ